MKMLSERNALKSMATSMGRFKGCKVGFVGKTSKEQGSFTEDLLSMFNRVSKPPRHTMVCCHTARAADTRACSLITAVISIWGAQLARQ